MHHEILHFRPIVISRTNCPKEGGCVADMILSLSLLNSHQQGGDVGLRQQLMALLHIECPVRKTRIACKSPMFSTAVINFPKLHQMLKSISNGNWMKSCRICWITCCMGKKSWKCHSSKEWSLEFVDWMPFSGRPINWIVTINQ